MTSSLEILILALVEQGLATPYDLGQARLSVGAAHAALLRLVKRKLLTKGKAGARGKMEYQLTDAGREALASWTELLGQFETGVPPDLESTFRIVALAYTKGRRREALSVLERAAAKRREALTNAKSPPKTAAEVGNKLEALYSWMTAVAQAARTEYEARAVQHIIRVLRRK